MPAPAEIKKLVEKFARNRDEYMASSYNEHQVRIEFINPLLKALGWDVDNSEGASERYREVVHEDRVMVGGENKAPDYSCRLGGNRVFFVEAKKPSVDLKTNPGPAFQLRRYAWSAKLPVSVLTDFEELVIYDTTIKPGAKDKPTVGRLRYWTSSEFVEKWDEIAGILSKESVKSGAFDSFAGERKRKAVAQVDDDFLEAIEEWRDLLARDLAKENPKLESEELSFAVQRILDRIVFLRICEDRGIDSPGQLHALTNGPGIYGRLKQLFDRADKKYNSGLFHFREEKDRHESPDTLTPKLKFGDKALKTIIDALYDDAPWAFGVIPADILGSIYEQFLGKVIRRDGRGVTIDEKPEVKKAGGVYYTPKYIVDYIVKETVGRLLEGKTPKEAAELKILDPACGSGSFLIGAYQYLLDWHLDQYLKVPEKHKKQLTEFPKGVLRLSSVERKRILTNSIFGVDIDAQAVEVTKLSLLLKVLEGESAQSLQVAFELMPERALPDLGDNVKRGNSLVGPNVIAGQIDLLGLEYGLGVLHPFDWPAEFPSAMKRANAGFDVVLGNPPYGASLNEIERDYIQRTYSVYRYKFDSYLYFIEQGVILSRVGGMLSYITPEMWLALESAEPLRRLLGGKGSLSKVVVHGEGVFADAVISTATFVFQRGEPSGATTLAFKGESWDVPVANWTASPGAVIEYRQPPAVKSVVDRIREEGDVLLGALGDAIQGITPYDKYVGHSASMIKKRAFHAMTRGGKEWGHWLDGRDVSRYTLSWSGEWLRYGDWLAAPREARFFEGTRLLFRESPGPGRRIQAALCQERAYYGHAITPFVVVGAEASSYFLLGVVNSKLLSWYAGVVFPNFGKATFPKLNPQDIKALPIRLPRAGDVKEGRLATDIAKRAEQLQASGDQSAPEATRVRALVDAEVDRLVYQLYGISAEQIDLIEKWGRPTKGTPE